MGTNYAVHLKIGSSSGGDFHLEGHCQNFPHDIRFTRSDGETELKYWIEDLGADPIDVWVKIPDSLDSNVDIYVYYGRSGVQTTRNGDDTFDFFDDFEGDSVDTNKWIDSAFDGEVADSKLRIKPYTGYNSNVLSLTCFQKPKQLVFKGFLRAESNRWDHAGFNRMIKDCDNSEANVACYNYIDAYGRCASIANTEDGTRYCNYVHPAWDSAVWRRYHIKWKDGDVGFWLTPSSQWYHFTEHTPAGCMRVRLGSRRESGAPDTYTEIDWVFVAPYHDPEPTFSSASSEEHCAELAGTSDASSSLLGTAKRIRNYSGISSALVTITAPLSLLWSLSASSPAQSTTSSILSITFPLSGSSSASSTTSSVLKPFRSLSATSQASLSTQALLSPLRRLLGSSSAISSTQAPLSLLYILSGITPSQSTTTAHLFRCFSLTSQIPATSVCSGTLSPVRSLLASSSPFSTTQASLHQSFSLSGYSSSTTTLSGTLYPVTFISGSFSSSSSTQGLLHRFRSLSSICPCSSTLTGSITHTFKLQNLTNLHTKSLVTLSIQSTTPRHTSVITSRRSIR